MTIDIICKQSEAEETAKFFKEHGANVAFPPAPLEAGGSGKQGNVRLQITIDAIVQLAKIIFEFLNDKPSMTIEFKSNTVEKRIPENATIAQIEAAIIINNSREFVFKIEG